MSSTIQSISSNPIFVVFSVILIIIIVILVGYLIIKNMVRKMNSYLNTKNILFNTPHSLSYKTEDALLATPIKFPVLSKINSNISYSINTWFHIDSSTNHTSLKHLFTVAGNSKKCSKQNPCEKFETIEDQRPTVWLDGPSNAIYVVFNNLRSGNVYGSISEFKTIKNIQKGDTVNSLQINGLTEDIIKAYPMLIEHGPVNSTSSTIILGSPPTKEDVSCIYPLLIGLHHFIHSSDDFTKLSTLFDNNNNYFNSFLQYSQDIVSDTVREESEPFDLVSIYSLKNASFQQVLLYVLKCYNQFYIRKTDLLLGADLAAGDVMLQIKTRIQENISNLQNNKHSLGFALLLYITSQLYNIWMNDIKLGLQHGSKNMNLLASYDSNSPLNKLDLIHSLQHSDMEGHQVQRLLSIIGLCVIKIENIPVKRWFMFSIIAYQHSAEIYINSKIVRSIVLPTGFSLSNNDNLKDRYLYVGMQDLSQSSGSITASITNFSYYNYVLTPDTLQYIYTIGPKKGFITKLKTKLDKLKQFFLLSTFDNKTFMVRGKSIGNYLEKHLGITDTNTDDDYSINTKSFKVMGENIGNYIETHI